ncbi:unnamed protein product [Calypogeia fissa]
MAATTATSICCTIASPSRCILSSKDLRVASPLRNVSCTKYVTGKTNLQRSLRLQAFMDIQNDPIVKEALKEPVAFLGGVFAGLLRLDLNEEPLREWVAKTAEAAGIATDEPESKSSDDAPNEIEIE